MKAVKIAILLTISVLLLLSLGCGRNKPTIKPTGEEVYRPTWWGQQKDDDVVCTYGQATKVSETISIDTAKNNAIYDVAQFVEVYVAGMVKTYEEEAGVFDPQLLALSSKVVKTVAEARFNGIQYDKIETRKVEEMGMQRFKTWVQAKIPRAEINKSISANIRNEEALYNQFKASQAFRELEDEVN